MMALTIPDAIRPRLGAIVRRLASDQPGEVVAAASVKGYGRRPTQAERRG